MEGVLCHGATLGDTAAVGEVNVARGVFEVEIGEEEVTRVAFEGGERKEIEG